MSWANPNGEWDVWAAWNLGAKFLAASEDWRDAASPVLSYTHPEYPLLLPSFVVRGWLISGERAAVVPIATGLFFFAALAGLLVGALGILRGPAAAMIGGMLLLSAQPLLNWAPSQYADIPLACLILATFALVLLDTLSESPRSTTLVWAGLCAGLAAWTKQEGMPFAGALVALFLPAARVAYGAWRPALERWRRLLAGAVPGLFLALWFKLWIAPPGSDEPRTMAEALSRLVQPDRYAIVVRSFLEHLTGLGSGPGHPLILLVMLAPLLRLGGYRRSVAAIWTGAAALFAMLGSYVVALVASPRDLKWHIFTSMDRLILQLWPGFVLILCALLPEDLDRMIGDGLARLRQAFGRSAPHLYWRIGAAITLIVLVLYPFVRALRTPAESDLLALSYQHYQAKRFPEAIATAKELLAKHPNSAAAYINLAVSYAALGRWDNALNSAQNALSIEPDNQLARNNLAWILQERRQVLSQEREKLTPQGRTPGVLPQPIAGRIPGREIPGQHRIGPYGAETPPRLR